MTMEAAVPETKVSVLLEGAAGGGGLGVSFLNADTGQIYGLPGDGRRARGLSQAEDEDGDAAAPVARTIFLPPHLYEVRVAGQDQYLAGVTANKAKVTGSLVEIGEAEAEVTLRIASGRANLNGVARREGKTAAGAMVLLVPATFGQAGGGVPLVRQETNTDGSFALRAVQPGPYILVVLEHGWDVNWQDPETLARTLAGGVPLALKPGATVQEEVTSVLP